MTKVYVSPEVGNVISLYSYLTDPAFRTSSIADQIHRQAQTLHTAFHAADPRVRMQVSCWWPGARGQDWAVLQNSAFSTEDAAETLRREYGFADADALAQIGDMAPDPAFEQALDYVLTGDVDGLSAMLAQGSGLATARSRYGHGATLLHYLGANGVESHRQVTPLNAVEMADILLAAGARKDAEANMYGGGQTAYALASTSAHPHRAGVAPALNAVLRPG